MVDGAPTLDVYDASPRPRLSRPGFGARGSPRGSLMPRTTVESPVGGTAVPTWVSGAPEPLRCDRGADGGRGARRTSGVNERALLAVDAGVRRVGSCWPRDRGALPAPGPRRAGRRRAAGDDRLPGGRGARRSRAAHRAGPRAAAPGRRRRLRPAVGGRRCSTWRRRAPSGSTSARRPAASRCRRSEINALLVDQGRGGRHGRAPQGRRPLRLRPRRRGGGGAGGGRRARSRSCRASPRPSPRPPTPASPSRCATRPRRSPSSPATRTPTPARTAPSTGEAVARVGGTIVILMGVGTDRADRRAADRRRSARRTRRRPPSGGARGPSRRACGRRSARSPIRTWRRRR